MSGVVAFVVNERSQAREDSRVARMQTAERERLQIQFAESAKKEQRDAARQARRDRLQPAVEMLVTLEEMVGVQIEASAWDALKPQIEKNFGPIDGGDWTTLKSGLIKAQSPSFVKVIGTYFPKVVSIPAADLATELRFLIATVATNRIPRMSAEQRNEFLARIRATRDLIDAEIVRGEWP